MPNFLSALAAGFWSRLMAYISAARAPNAARVAELSATAPTNVAMSVDDAGQLLDIGIRARQAAGSWFAGVPVEAISPPSVAMPSTPNIEGGPPGKYEVGLVWRQLNEAGDRTGQETPIVFSSDCTGSVADCIQALDEFADSLGQSESDKRLRQYVRQVASDLLYRPRQAFVPLYLVERLRTG